MPEIDRELFQLLLLALMAIAILLLLALVSTLSGIRKALKEQVQETRNLAESGTLASRESGEPPLLPSAPVEERVPALQTPDPSHYGIDDSDDRPLVGGDAAPGAAHVASAATEPDVSPAPFTPEPASEEPASASTAAPWDLGDEDEERVGTAASAPETGPTRSADPFAETGQPDEAYAADPFAGPPEPAETPTPSQEEAPAAAAPSGTGEDDPFGGDAPASQDVLAGTPGSSSDDPFLTGDDENPFMRDADQPAPQSTLEEPEEQPFERNGRWFFKREGELLVYEEGTGEWVPADPSDAEPPKSPPSWSASSAAEPTESATGLGGAPTDTAELDAVEAADEEPRPAAGGGFWKCPSCGAVNGSSATTCRMCFSARP